MILGGEEMEVRMQMELFDKKFVYLEWDDVLQGKKVFIGDTLPQLRVSVNEHCDSLQEVSKNISDDSFYPFISLWGTRYAMVYYDPNYSCKRAYMEGKTIQCRNKGDDNWIVTSNPKWVDRCEYRVKPEEPAVIPEMWTACINDEGVISIMPACEWNKNKGMQLIEGTEEKCKDYAVENYCKKCVHEVSICCSPRFGCQGFSEQVEVKKRRMTNRELAKWVWQGNGQVKHRDGKYTLVACTAYDIRDDDKPCSDYYVIRGWDETEWSEPLIEE